MAFWVTKPGAANWVGQAFRTGGIGADGRADALVGEWQKLELLIPDADAKDDRKRPVKTTTKLNQVMAARYRSQR